MKETENVALVDMDGTVCDYHGTLERDIRELGSDVDKLSPETREKLGILIRNQPGWYRRLPPIELGLDIVELLRGSGFSIMVLTKGNTRRNLNAWTEKVQWVAEHMPYAKVTVTEDKGLVYGKILVDNFKPYVERWLQWRPRGLVILPNQPWNQDCTGPNITRISSDSDLRKLFPLLRRHRARKGGEKVEAAS
jgi:5'-nucleotidase